MTPIRCGNCGGVRVRLFAKGEPLKRVLIRCEGCAEITNLVLEDPRMALYPEPENDGSMVLWPNGA